MTDSWLPPGRPDDEEARQRAYQRLTDAARRAGLSLERLHDLLDQLRVNEAETRRFLSEEVYGVPDDLLDDLLRLRLKGGEADPRSDSDPGDP